MCMSRSVTQGCNRKMRRLGGGAIRSVKNKLCIDPNIFAGGDVFVACICMYSFDIFFSVRVMGNALSFLPSAACAASSFSPGLNKLSESLRSICLE